MRVGLRLFGAPILHDPIYTQISQTALYNPAAALPYVPAVDEEDFDYPLHLTARCLSFTDPLNNITRTLTTTIPHDGDLDTPPPR